MIPLPIFPSSENRYWVGKCQSCRFSLGAIGPGLVMVCTKNSKYETTRPHWQCAGYEYEPGSIE